MAADKTNGWLWVKARRYIVAFNGPSDVGALSRGGFVIVGDIYSAALAKAGAVDMTPPC